jgi:hypothetical protein
MSRHDIRNLRIRINIENFMDLIKKDSFELENSVRDFRRAILYGGQAPVGYRDSEGYTGLLMTAFPHPLLQAIVTQNEIDVDSFFIYRDPNKVVKDIEGLTALDYAAGQGNQQILQRLLSQPAYSKQPNIVQQALTIAKTIMGELKPAHCDFNRYQQIAMMLKAHLPLKDSTIHRYQESALEQIRSFSPPILPKYLDSSLQFSR